VHYTFYALTHLIVERGAASVALTDNRRRIMRKLFVVLTYALAGLALGGSLTGCVVAPAQPAYYGYDYDSGYYAPGYYAYPAEPSVGIGIGFGGSGGHWHGDHDWHGDRGWHGGHGWRDGH
jgi:hypothetical protein